MTDLLRRKSLAVLHRFHLLWLRLMAIRATERERMRRALDALRRR